MKTMSVGEFKTHFSEVIEQVKAGEKIAVTFGRKKEVIGYFTSESPQPETKRKLGIMEGKAKAVFKKDFKIPKTDFLDNELPVRYPYAYMVDNWKKENYPLR